MEIFSLDNTYGKRIIQGTKDICFEFNNIRMEAIHIEEQVRCLSER